MSNENVDSGLQPVKSTKRKVAYFLLLSDMLALFFAFVVGGAIGYAVNKLLIDVPYAVLEDRHSLVERAVIFGVLSFAVIGWIGSVTRYDRGIDGWKQFGATLQAIFFAFVVDVVIQYVTKQSFSRLWLMGSWASALLLMPLFYFAMVKWLDTQGIWKRKVVVLQGDSVPLSTGMLLKNEWPNRYDIVGEEVIDWNSGKEAIENLLLKYSEDDILYIFAVKLSEIDQVEKMCCILERVGADFYIIPELGSSARRGLYEEMSFKKGIPFIRGSNRLLKQSNQRIKRIMDVTLSLVGLLVIGLPMLVLAIMIKKDGGPAIYGHSRVGHKGREFKCLKFRSMHVNSQEILEEILENDPVARAEWEKNFKLKNDPRITPIGNFIRKTSIDELPQLFNVLKGEMSLVGPRPVVRKEINDYYGKEAGLYTAVIPGITGLWQISGRNDTTYEKRVDLDSRYARSWSVFLDLKILLMTPIVVLYRKGAY
ncbi:exopolysaccharide biosynthesis polyprenyl glycosylphosphotransferase [Terasakiella sp. A23]|uniref:exopolysaccharide biosynthesis polyprenyl glycosylphosphotransferase n=1 Tax=Terasakiella sp. FCG-A23 TaxID=3080561 RepID=UPI002952B8C7|nr:exopolysaccharide biosynthesis polyprenyl glycosylphosphotransferase [Terasakiella sp. A23]MDV7341619.1 exopolysaccharide biosynthesis polyprenyl glycosylphosphotransferase [Terasakiella sp. A23]